jgi:hypothetical protein
MEKYRAILPKKRQLSLENFQKFRGELNELKEYFFESSIYRPLEIDGKRFNTFLEKGNNLTLRPDMILNLWLSLVNPHNKTRSEEGKIRQKQLLEQGPDPWLEQLGFRGINTLNQTVPENRLPRLQQVVISLCTRLLSETDFIQITNLIEQLTDERYRFPLKDDHNNLVEDNFDQDSAIKFVNQYIESREGKSERKNAIKNKFRNSLSDMETTAKTLFSQEEIIGLLLNIDRQVDKRAEIYTTHTCALGVELINCEITSPSMELPLNLGKLLKHTGIEPQDLRQANITFKILNTEEPAPLHWRFTSTGTILANLVLAVERGLGYRGYLTNLQPNLTTLGSSINSLCNFRATYKDHTGQEYRGQWVDMDSIFCFAKALIICGEDWLYSLYESLTFLLKEREIPISKKQPEQPLTHSVEYDHLKSASTGVGFFFEKAQEVAQFQSILYKNNIYAYRVNPAAQKYMTDKKPDIDQLLSDTDSSIHQLIAAEQLYSNLLNCQESDFIIYKNFIKELFRIKAFAHLFQARSATIRGELDKSEAHLKQVSINPELGHAHPVMLTKLKEAEELLWALSTDTELPILNPGTLSMDTSQFWEYHHLDLLNAPKACNNDPFEFEYPGIDDYLAISELFGNTARINFYKTEDYHQLELTARWFGIAALYASKIGYEKRCCHWLCMASRTWSRIGKWARAKEFNTHANEIGQLALSPNSRELNRSFVSEINLSWGEWYLYPANAKHNIEWALTYFVKALLGSAYRGYARRVADCLYNIGRAAKDERASNLTIGQILTSTNTNQPSRSSPDSSAPRIDSFRDGLDDVERKINLWRINEPRWIAPFGEALKLLKQCEEALKSDPNKTWADMADNFLNAAANTWNTWASQTQAGHQARKHSFEAKILRQTFLGMIPKPESPSVKSTDSSQKT